MDGGTEGKLAIERPGRKLKKRPGGYVPGESNTGTRLARRFLVVFKE
jgi:hypothetical protein